jgi:imidazoleglycerol-phosphate dehydratase
VSGTTGRRAVAGDTSCGERIAVTLELDGRGRADVATGDEFLDHLLELVVRHARFDLTIAIGDAREVCGDRVVESIAGALGRALRDALGAEQGIRRSGSATMPFDEALALVALDLSGRPYLAYDIDLAGVRIDAFDADLARRFLRALVDAAGITLHVRLLSGSDPQNIVDAVFEGLGEALRTACESLG